jgi:CubicO group peptidase (beta-lactamase class C family)
MDNTEVTVGCTRTIAIVTTPTGLQGCMLAKTVVHNFADPDDHRIFASRAMPRGVALSAQAPSAHGKPRRASETVVQVLGFVLERAVNMPVSDYVAAKLSQPLRLESKALSALDRDGGNEKAFRHLTSGAHTGQYSYVNPAARVVLVKFSETGHQDPVPMFRALAAAVTAPTHLAEIDRLDGQLLAAR